MPTVQVEAHLSSKELLRAASQLNTNELDEFVQQVMTLRAKRTAPSLPHAEAELLLKINEGVPDATQERFNELRTHQENETLTLEEHQELLQLIDQIENIDAQRVKYLAELSQLRQTTVRALMDELGIYPPDYA